VERDTAIVADDVVEHLRAICSTFPETYEESAWVGTRWRIRARTFAHVLVIAGGRPEGYARAVGVPGPVTVLMFRSSGPELDVLRSAGPPFFAPPWRPDEVGMVLTGDPDWDEVCELLTESYCAQAPKGLAAKVERPGG